MLRQSPKRETAYRTQTGSPQRQQVSNCRCQLQQEVDNEEENEFEIKNKTLTTQVEKLQNNLLALNEKLTILNEVKRDLQQHKNLLQISENARQTLQEQFQSSSTEIKNLQSENAARHVALIQDNNQLKLRCEDLQQKLAQAKSDQQKIEASLIEKSLKREDEHLNQISELNNSFLEQKGRMIQERCNDHEAHQAALKLKADEAAARDQSYVAEITKLEQSHSDQMQTVQVLHLAQLSDLNETLQKRDKQYIADLKSLEESNAKFLSDLCQKHAQELKQASSFLQSRDARYKAELANQESMFSQYSEEILSKYKADLDQERQIYNDQITLIQSQHQAQIQQIETRHNLQVKQMQDAHGDNLLSLDRKQQALIQRIQASHLAQLQSASDEQQERDIKYAEELEEVWTRNREMLANVQQRNQLQLSKASEDLQLRNNQYRADLESRNKNFNSETQKLVSDHISKLEKLNAQLDYKEKENLQHLERFAQQLISQENNHKEQQTEQQKKCSNQVYEAQCKLGVVKRLQEKTVTNLTKETEAFRAQLQAKLDQQDEILNTFPQTKSQLDLEIVALRQTLQLKYDVESQLAQARQNELLVTQAKQDLLKVLEKQKEAAYITEFEEKLSQWENKNTTLRAQIKLSEQSNSDLKFEIEGMRSYIVDLKQMVKMLLDPQGVTIIKEKAMAQGNGTTSIDDLIDSLRPQDEEENYPANKTQRVFAGKVAVTRVIQPPGSPIKSSKKCL